MAQYLKEKKMELTSFFLLLSVSGEDRYGRSGHAFDVQFLVGHKSTTPVVAGERDLTIVQRFPIPASSGHQASGVVLAGEVRRARSCGGTEQEANSSYYSAFAVHHVAPQR